MEVEGLSNGGGGGGVGEGDDAKSLPHFKRNSHGRRLQRLKGKEGGVGKLIKWLM